MSSAPVASSPDSRAERPLAPRRRESAPRFSPVSEWRKRSIAIGAVAWLTLLLLPPASASAGADAVLRLRSLDCGNVSARSVAETLVQFPAPRVVALQGSVPIVTMAPLLAFFEAMGYPQARLVQSGPDPRSRSSFVDARRIAGELAWHYERDALMPVLIGHSQGGMVVVKVLHELASTRPAPAVPVWPPDSDAPQARTTIVDPYTGERRAVTDLDVDFASALVTGSLPRIILGQWGMLPLLRDVPDSVVEFTGFSIPWDPIAGTGAEPAPYRATGTARVRNVVLPPTYSHVTLPRAEHLAAQPATRAWIDAFDPAAAAALPQADDTSNLLLAAELWYSLKRHWCEGAKRLARREGAHGATPASSQTDADERAPRASR